MGRSPSRREPSHLTRSAGVLTDANGVGRQAQHNPTAHTDRVDYRSPAPKNDLPGASRCRSSVPDIEARQLARLCSARARKSALSTLFASAGHSWNRSPSRLLLDFSKPRPGIRHVIGGMAPSTQSITPASRPREPQRQVNALDDGIAASQFRPESYTPIWAERRSEQPESASSPLCLCRIRPLVNPRAQSTARSCLHDPNRRNEPCRNHATRERHGRRVSPSAVRRAGRQPLLATREMSSDRGQANRPDSGEPTGFDGSLALIRPPGTLRRRSRGPLPLSAPTWSPR